jgi:hypothetical protein
MSKKTTEAVISRDDINYSVIVYVNNKMIGYLNEYFSTLAEAKEYCKELQCDEITYEL